VPLLPLQTTELSRLSSLDSPHIRALDRSSSLTCVVCLLARSLACAKQLVDPRRSAVELRSSEVELRRSATDPRLVRLELLGSSLELWCKLDMEPALCKFEVEPRRSETEPLFRLELDALRSEVDPLRSELDPLRSKRLLDRSTPRAPLLF